VCSVSVSRASVDQRAVSSLLRVTDAALLESGHLGSARESFRALRIVPDCALPQRSTQYPIADYCKSKSRKPCDAPYTASRRRTLIATLPAEGPFCLYFEDSEDLHLYRHSVTTRDTEGASLRRAPRTSVAATESTAIRTSLASSYDS
jgi:hypothetical protein